MSKKTRERLEQQAKEGKVHRDGAEAEGPIKCEVPHCHRQQMTPRVRGLPLCQDHTERFMTQLYFDDKIKAAKRPAGMTKGGLYVATGSREEKEAMTNIARGFGVKGQHE